MNKRSDKKAQLKLSFGMIFSIILILIFLAFAFYAIQKLLSVKNSVDRGQLVTNIQNDVDKMWKSSEGSQKVEYNFPSGVEKLCFTNFKSPATGQNSALYRDLDTEYTGKENLFFYPIQSSNILNSKDISHIDLAKITQGQNPFCIDNINGKISLTIKKDFNEALVTITK